MHYREALTKAITTLGWNSDHDEEEVEVPFLTE
jgi:hypothetical protein